MSQVLSTLNELVAPIVVKHLSIKGLRSHNAQI